MRSFALYSNVNKLIDEKLIGYEEVSCCLSIYNAHTVAVMTKMQFEVIRYISYQKTLDEYCSDCS